MIICDTSEIAGTVRVDSHADALAFYRRLREANRALHCDFFEDVVMKRTDSDLPRPAETAHSPRGCH